MGRRLILPTVLACLLAIFTFAEARQPTALGDARAAQLANSPGTLELHNRLFEQVRVEVSIGASANCDKNEIVGPVILSQSQSWAVLSEQLVCWRRDQAPGDSSSGWTPWVQVQLGADELRDVTL